MKLAIGIIGAGKIGAKRAEVIRVTRLGRLAAIADINRNAAQALAQRYGCDCYQDYRQLLARSDIDVVVVAVPHNLTHSIVRAALRQRKHVLCEKPFGTTTKEAIQLCRVAEQSRRLVKVGFNHRFHPGLRKARQLFERGAIGKLFIIRARYGYGGRLGLEREWRFRDPIGGGELLDQGVHLIDLVQWFAGPMTEVFGLTETKFWKTVADDNAFALLRNKRVTASFHVSATNWKNLFSFELFGERGYLTIEGKGGSYGRETVIWGKRPATFGVPAVKTYLFTRDTSWQDEWRHFIAALNGKTKLMSGPADGLAVNRVVAALRQSSKQKRIVRLSR